MDNFALSELSGNIRGSLLGHICGWECEVPQKPAVDIFGGSCFLPLRYCQRRKPCVRYLLPAQARKTRKGAGYAKYLVMVGNGPFSYCMRLIGEVGQRDLSVGCGPSNPRESCGPHLDAKHAALVIEYVQDVLQASLYL